MIVRIMHLKHPAHGDVRYTASFLGYNAHIQDGYYSVEYTIAGQTVEAGVTIPITHSIMEDAALAITTVHTSME
jgi:hypothetical protein